MQVIDMKDRKRRGLAEESGGAHERSCDSQARQNE